MKEYKIRIYRDNFNRDRWQTFTISYKESDLCIGIDTASYVPEMNLFAGQILRELRLEMDAYITNDPTYAVILSPYFPAAGAPGILVRMAEAAATAGVGPMAAVAGAIAEYIGRRLKTEYDCREVIVENGGDIYADIVEGMDIPVFTGQSPLSEKVGIFIPEGGRISICTSSGTVGPSLSFGMADAVMIVCSDAALADSYATAFANKIHTKQDINNVIAEIRKIPAISGAICIKDDMFGICGEYGLKIWKQPLIR